MIYNNIIITEQKHTVNNMDEYMCETYKTVKKRKENINHIALKQSILWMTLLDLTLFSYYFLFLLLMFIINMQM